MPRMSDYEAFEHYNAEGTWPKGHPSPAIKEMAQKYDVPCNHTLVVEYVMRSEIERLRKTPVGVAVERADVLREEVRQLKDKLQATVEGCREEIETASADTDAVLGEKDKQIDVLKKERKKYMALAAHWEKRRNAILGSCADIIYEAAVFRDTGVWHDHDVLKDLPSRFPPCDCGNRTYPHKRTEMRIVIGYTKDEYNPHAARVTLMCPDCGEFTEDYSYPDADCYKYNLRAYCEFDRDIKLEDQ